jgi:hypothetical protein
MTNHRGCYRVSLENTSPRETLPGQGNRQTLNSIRGLTGQLHSHDPWAGEGPLVSMLRHTFPRFSPFGTRVSSYEAPAPALQWASIVGHPGSRRAAHSARTRTCLDSDSARWPKWNLDRVWISGNGISGTLRCCGTHPLV